MEERRCEHSDHLHDGVDSLGGGVGGGTSAHLIFALFRQVICGAHLVVRLCRVVLLRLARAAAHKGIEQRCKEMQGDAGRFEWAEW